MYIYLKDRFPLREIEFFRWQSSVCPGGRKFDNNGRGITAIKEDKRPWRYTTLWKTAVVRICRGLINHWVHAHSPTRMKISRTLHFVITGNCVNIENRQYGDLCSSSIYFTRHDIIILNESTARRFCPRVKSIIIKARLASKDFRNLQLHMFRIRKSIFLTAL